MIRVIRRRLRNDRTGSAWFLVWARVMGAWGRGRCRVVGVVVVLFRTKELSGVVRGLVLQRRVSAPASDVLVAGKE
jgi:hypothetical protein